MDEIICYTCESRAQVRVRAVQVCTQIGVGLKHLKPVFVKGNVWLEEWGVGGEVFGFFSRYL